jgi:hypothetical protein
MEKKDLYRIEFLLEESQNENRIMNVVMISLLSIIVIQLMVIIDKMGAIDIF